MLLKYIKRDITGVAMLYLLNSCRLKTSPVWEPTSCSKSSSVYQASDLLQSSSFCRCVPWKSLSRMISRMASRMIFFSPVFTVYSIFWLNITDHVHALYTGPLITLLWIYIVFVLFTCKSNLFHSEFISVPAVPDLIEWTSLVTQNKDVIPWTVSPSSRRNTLGM